jgi:hypothetical protein
MAALPKEIHISRTKGWMARMYLIPERMVARWEGLRVGKDTPCRVPPLWEKHSVISMICENLVEFLYSLRLRQKFGLYIYRFPGPSPLFCGSRRLRHYFIRPSKNNIGLFPGRASDSMVGRIVFGCGHRNKHTDVYLHPGCGLRGEFNFPADRFRIYHRTCCCELPVSS